VITSLGFPTIERRCSVFWRPPIASRFCERGSSSTSAVFAAFAFLAFLVLYLLSHASLLLLPHSMIGSSLFLKLRTESLRIPTGPVRGGLQQPLLMFSFCFFPWVLFMSAFFPLRSTLADPFCVLLESSRPATRDVHTRFAPSAVFSPSLLLTVSNLIATALTPSILSLFSSFLI